MPADVKTKDERVVRDVLDLDIRPEFKYRIEVGVDQAGGRALWVIFALPPSLANSSNAAERLRLLADRVQRAAIAKNIRRWPYIRFEAA